MKHQDRNVLVSNENSNDIDCCVSCLNVIELLLIYVFVDVMLSGYICGELFFNDAMNYYDKWRHNVNLC